MLDLWTYNCFSTGSLFAVPVLTTTENDPALWALEYVAETMKKENICNSMMKDLYGTKAPNRIRGIN